MNKQGVQLVSETVIKVILLVATIAVVVFIFFGNLLSNMKESYEENICRATITIQTATQITATGITVDSPVQINCPRRRIHIGDKESYVEKTNKLQPKAAMPIYQTEGDKLVAKESYTTISKEITNSMFSESMRRCWQLAGSGKEKVFNSGPFLSYGNVCMICDEFLFEPVNPLTTSSSSQSLKDYMTKTIMPKQKEGEKMTYYEFLFTARSLGGNKNMVSGGTTCIDKNAISWDPEIAKGSYATILFRDFSLIGDDGCINVYVVPASKVRSLCEYVAN